MIRHVCLLAALVLCLAVPSTSSAYWPYMGYGGWGGWGWGGFNQPTDYRPAPPYYALYPPVYYSPHITARHYGASPFAWYPGMQPITYTSQADSASYAQAVAVAAPEPLMIENPYVKGTRATSAKADRVEVQPLRIDNPFVVSTSR